MRIKTFIASIIALVSAAPAAFAYTVTPLSMVLQSSGSGAVARIAITNSDSSPVDVEAIAQRVTVDAAGKRSFATEPNALLVFPPQVSVPPGATRQVIVRYVGDPKLSAGQLYSIRVSQRSVSDPVAGAQSISVLQDFIVTAPVNPVGAVAVTRLAEKPSFDKDGAIVTISNDGPAVADLSGLGFVAVKPGGARSLVPSASIAWGETRFLPPGQTRVVRLSGIAAGADVVLGKK